ncbi:ABC transporter permease [Paraburkholderia sp. J67]|uniref:ABC transporter permease n=1 Tax=Paraburkholderia sp. J67 TaxID=2805435 RepID=UPI002ABD7F03|nr:ABC transporter permease [Paraburkholderia sp. J67]
MRNLSLRLLRTVSTLLIVLLATFFITRIAYQDPAVMLAPRNATQETIDAVAHALRLDEPWYHQLWYYVYRGPDILGAPMGLAHWPPALGYSFRHQAPVTDLILAKVPVTLSLAAGALVISVIFSVALGVLAARFAGSWLDRGLAVFAYGALSVPTFLSGMLASYFLFYQLSLRGIHVFPGGGYVPLGEDAGQWARHLILPWLTLSIAEVGIFQRIVRASMLNVLSADYVRTARAKGVPEWQVQLRHAWSAALNPVLALGGLEFAGVMGGAIVTEQMFGLDGVGRLAVTSALDGDFPVVIGTTIFAAFVFVVCTLAVDLIVRWRDPKSAV